MFTKEAAFLVVICLVFFQHLIHPTIEGRKILTREEEDMELERQLEIINKPAIKTFQTKYGDIYGCVDINKQPAFDHPSLKNHTIQLRPSSYPKGLIKNKEEGSSTLDSSIWHKTETCPDGTVAIRRIQKQDLIREKSSRKKITFRTNSVENPGYHFATVDIRRSGLHGVLGFTNTHQPSVEHGQFSMAGISILNQQEILAAGWRVDPAMHGDFLTRMFIYWGNDSQTTGCSNLLCSGFVQIDKEPVDMVIEKISVYGGKQYVFQNCIFQDKETGNWWFSYPEGQKQVGYWPKELFKNLANEGTMVVWGGQTFQLPGQNSPAMGNGHFPHDNLKKDMNGYFKSMQFADQDFVVRTPASSKDFEKLVDNKCYGVGDIVDLVDDEGQTFNYGGPGGDCGN